MSVATTSFISLGLEQLERADIGLPADHGLARLLAADAKTAQAQLAACVIILGWLREQGHTVLPLDRLRDQSVWPTVAQALGLVTEPAETDLLATGVVGRGLLDGNGDDYPLVLDNGRLSWQRIWHYEQSLARRFKALTCAPETGLVGSAEAPGLDPGQQQALNIALGKRFAVVSGGPGTGKTTVAATIIAGLTSELSIPPHRIGLTAPTGKAAARLQRALSERTSTEQLPEVKTLHRLLGLSRVRPPKYGPDNPLPVDAVLVDEASMVDLELMHLLMQSLGSDCRLIVVGDWHQLSAVGVGNVLAEVSVPAAWNEGHLALLEQNYRFGQQGQLTRLARAVIDGEIDGAIAVLAETVDAGANDGLKWQQSRPGDLEGWLRTMVPADFLIQPDDPALALERSNAFRILVAHRGGPTGVNEINRTMRQLLEAPASGRFSGELLQVTGNDYEMKLFNGDQAVVRTGDDGRLVAWFESGGGLRSAPAQRLQRVQSAWAMTVHKSQGSEFDHVVLMLPEESSPLATRQWLYTAITRARKSLTIVGSERALGAAIITPVVRFSGLGDKLRQSA